VQSCERGTRPPTILRAMRGSAEGFIGAGLAAAMAITGCDGKGQGTGASTSSTKATGDAPVVIELGPNGQSKVRGKELKGDAATCNSMKACCAASSDVNLFCGLAQATDGATCASVLGETQKYLSERKLGKPAGCP
jgi:hypothetical protein